MRGNVTERNQEKPGKGVAMIFSVTTWRLIITLLLFSVNSFSQSTNYLKVHFLYGSKPVREHRDTERKWFGGILGGHVGIEADSDKVISFFRNGEFHYVARKNNRHSRYVTHSRDRFYSIFGGSPESKKRAIIYVPVTIEQKQKFDSIISAYREQTPYDYAFIGMRCGSAAYEILAQLEVLPAYGYRRTYWKIFYPRRLRRPLVAKAKENNWTVEQYEGSKTRKWERD
jgi:hypothetical protein